MRRLLPVVCGVFMIIACNDTSGVEEKKSQTAGNNILPQADSSTTLKPGDNFPANIQIDSVIYLAFAPGNVSVSVKGHIDKKGEPVICFLPVTIGKTLEASVIPDNKKATIRFSHLYFPDGKSDGPFGNTLNYDLKQKGTYRIYISPNMMAGDPVSSDFVLKVKVE
ncbi:MAG: hypothetical protein ACXWC7_04215 [Chitinophagaceae bacterium]